MSQPPWNSLVFKTPNKTLYYYILFQLSLQPYFLTHDLRAYCFYYKIYGQASKRKLQYTKQLYLNSFCRRISIFQSLFGSGALPLFVLLSNTDPSTAGVKVLALIFVLHYSLSLSQLWVFQTAQLYPIFQALPQEQAEPLGPKGQGEVCTLFPSPGKAFDTLTLSKGDMELRVAVAVDLSLNPALCYRTRR